MPEPDPFASPFHRVDLPGQGHAHAPLPPGFQLPAPMPPVHPADLGPRRPVTTTVASWSWIAGAVLAVIALPALFYTGVDLLTDDLVRDSAADVDPMTRGEAELSARFTPVLLMLSLAVLSVPFVIAAAKLRSGRNWARVTLTALGLPAGAFGFVWMLVFAAGGVPYVHWLWGVAWSWAFLGACALGFATMYLPASNAYTRAVTR
ncbi:hypothetical protein FHX81_4763 [Saccharothrix saharensis]|uniref:Uncharacterized protein n=1 Tax=Saccharothrix saharensis TaxID=571190 RepID=A0A543JHQ0_9PSEU|nr:hypothetical protein [Saccharothrix saharensis]TQM82359.1 hypothetical protein FHX81_4763 [Saccharothrix saharensis]